MPGLWHSLPIDQEYEGIWGQTLSGYVDTTGTFRVLFPSLNRNDLGTINTASRSWAHEYREQRFFLSGHKAPSISYIYQEYKKPFLDIGLKYNGKFSVIFDARSPLGPDAPTANDKIHPLLFSDQKRIEIKDNHWVLILSDRINQKTMIASGEFIRADSCKIRLDFKGNQRLLKINGSTVWAGNLDESGGHIGLSCDEHSSVDVHSFRIIGLFAAKTGVRKNKTYP